GAGVYGASGTFNGLTAGAYVVTVEDANLCTSTVNVNITEPTALVITSLTSPTFAGGVNVSCNGGTNGSAVVTVTGGNGAYSYIWYSDPAMTIPIGQFTSTAINLAAGTFYIKVTDINGCVVTGNIKLTQPTTLVASITSQTNVACFGNTTGSVTVNATPLSGTPPYQYSNDGGITWQATGTFNNLGAANYNIIVKDANSCLKSVPVSITQPLQLTATITGLTNVSCNGGNNGTVTVAATAGSGTSPYSYSIDGGGTWQAGSGAFTGLTAGTYTIIVRDANNCTINLPVVITEPATLQMTKTPDVLLNCYGDNTATGTFYASGGTMPYTFNTISNTTGATVPAPGFNSQTFFNAGAGFIIVGVTDSKSCTAQDTITITQPPLLTPGSIATNQILCNGDNPAMLTEVTAPTGGPGAYSYQWQYGANVAGPFINIAGANANTYTPPANATATLYYRRMVTSGSCTPVYSNVIEILVNPRPVAILTGEETICPGQTSNLVVTMPAGTGPFTVNIQNIGVINNYTSGNNIPVTPLATTTYSLLSVQDANTCQVTAPSGNLIGSATITVRALPAITVSPINKTTCEFGMVTFSVTATGDDLTYQWYVNEGAGFVPVVDGGIYFGSQTSSLMLFGTTRDMNTYIYHCVVTGCSTNVTSGDAVLTVNTAPEILNQPTDSTICQGANATFTINGQGTGLAYQWQVNKGAGFVNVVNDANFGGAILPTLTITNAPGTFNNYILRVKLSGTCGVPIYSNFVVLRVNLPPTVTANPSAKTICENGGPVYFVGNGTGMIDSLRWQVFTGGIWTDIYDNVIYSGTTTQQLAMVNVPVTYNGNQYRLSLKAECATSYTTGATLTVHANPVVDFTAVSPINACGGVPVVINGNPTGGSGVYTQNTWTGDVGPLSSYIVPSPTFNSQIAGVYNLNYKVKDSNGCTASDSLVVNVDAPDATFSTDVSAGCTPLTVNFTKDMTGIAKFWWDFGDLTPKDSVDASPTHIYTNATPATVEYYTVTLKVRSPGGCFATFTTSETVFPQIDPSFIADTNIVCSGGSITFNAQPGASKYVWDFGDGAGGSFSNIVTHLYTNFTTAPAILTVKLTTTSFYNCVNSQTMNITVMPVPLPQFTANPVSQTFNAGGNPVTFTNTTNTGTWTWAWRFGDGGTDATQSPVHIYTGIGTYNVMLTVSNSNCTDSVKHPVTIIPIPPVPSFDSIPSGCAPLTVQVNNTSTNVATPGITYTWDFGDGSPVSNVKNPTRTYFNSGIFVVTLTITDAYGNKYVATPRTVDAYASPQAYFQVAPTTVYVNDEAVRFFNQSVKVDPNDYYVWEFGDGDTSHLEDPYHKYMTEGVFDITLHAYSTNGCMNSWTLSPGVTVQPAGVIRFATVFTPNISGEQNPTVDQINSGNIDQFFFPPIKEEVLDYKLQIFNRWGTLIFESHDINIPWNGYYHGKLCKQGVYVWFVEGKYANGKPFKKVGDVTLLQ
ncbi:MAG: PKD domain-containing protein, partial [Bacteroidales bacterium]